MRIFSVLLVSIGLAAIQACLFLKTQKFESAETAISIVLMAIAIAHFNSRSSARLQLVIGATIYTVARFVIWRATCSLNLTDPANLMASLSFLIADVIGAGCLLLTCASIWRFPQACRQKLVSRPEAYLPSVDVFITTYSEPLKVVASTAVGALSIDYPNKKVYILDDGCRQEFADFAKKSGCHYISRSERRGAKSGNINNALSMTDGEFILTLDADHIPASTILNNSLGYFKDDNSLWAVQTAVHFINPGLVERAMRLPKETVDDRLFFDAGRVAANGFGGSFWLGSGATLRRSCLIEIGGIPGDVVVEDAYVSMIMNQKGYRFHMVPIPQVAGLNPENIPAYLIQQARWSKGNLQFLAIANPLFVRGLSIPQRLVYLQSNLIHFTYISRFIYTLLAPMYLLLHVAALNANLMPYLFRWLPLVMLADTPFIAQSMRLIRREVYDTLKAPALAKQFFELTLAPHLGGFRETPKGMVVKGLQVDLEEIAPHLVLLSLTIMGFFAGLSRLLQGTYPLGIWICMFWSSYQAFILFLCIRLAIETPNSAAEIILDLDLPATLKGEQSASEMSAVVTAWSEDCGYIRVTSSDQLTEGRYKIIVNPPGEPSFDISAFIQSARVSKEEQTYKFVLDDPLNNIDELKNFVRVGVSTNKRWQKLDAIYKSMLPDA